jgi:hypothetical protein
MQAAINLQSFSDQIVNANAQRSSLLGHLPQHLLEHHQNFNLMDLARLFHQLENRWSPTR